MEDDEDCKALSCLSVDCASAIASKFTTGGCFVTKAFVSIRERASATTFCDPFICRIVEVNCDI